MQIFPRVLWNNHSNVGGVLEMAAIGSAHDLPDSFHLLLLIVYVILPSFIIILLLFFDNSIVLLSNRPPPNFPFKNRLHNFAWLCAARRFYLDCFNGVDVVECINSSSQIRQTLLFSFSSMRIILSGIATTLQQQVFYRSLVPYAVASALISFDLWLHISSIDGALELETHTHTHTCMHDVKLLMLTVFVWKIQKLCIEHKCIQKTPERMRIEWSANVLRILCNLDKTHHFILSETFKFNLLCKRNWPLEWIDDVHTSTEYCVCVMHMQHFSPPDFHWLQTPVNIVHKFSFVKAYNRRRTECWNFSLNIVSNIRSWRFG